MWYCGQRALPVVRYWLRVALDSSRPPVFENQPGERNEQAAVRDRRRDVYGRDRFRLRGRSEEHTSELQSRPHLVCRLLLEKKNITDLDARTRVQHWQNTSHG